MSAATGTIGRAGSYAWVRFYWLTALLLAGLVAVMVVRALAGSEAGTAPAPSDRPAVSADRTENLPGWRYGPDGEMFPRPFTPIQSSSN
jgi:hypothetical protein